MEEEERLRREADAELARRRAQAEPGVETQNPTLTRIPVSQAEADAAEAERLRREAALRRAQGWTEDERAMANALQHMIQRDLSRAYDTWQATHQTLPATSPSPSL